MYRDVGPFNLSAQILPLRETLCLRGPTRRFDKSCMYYGCRTTCDTALRLPAMDQNSLPLFKNFNACVRHKVLSVLHCSDSVQRTYDLAL